MGVCCLPPTETVMPILANSTALSLIIKEARLDYLGLALQGAVKGSGFAESGRGQGTEKASGNISRINDRSIIPELAYHLPVHVSSSPCTPHSSAPLVMRKTRHL